MSSFTRLRRTLSSLSSGALVVSAVIVAPVAVTLATASSASADVSPIAPEQSQLATADALPTAQINGVAWTQALTGNTVFVGGSFSTARPAGAAPGSQQVTRNNLMSYTLSTGVMTSWAPVLDGQVRAMAISPDGTKLFVGGDFNNASGQVRSKIAAYSTSTGALLTTFAPSFSGSVRSLVATNTTVYAGGDFTKVNGNWRLRLAAIRISDGALLGWSPQAERVVTALAISTDTTRVIAGGQFTTINTAASYGLAEIDASSGALLPTNIDQTVRVAGPNAAITSLKVSGDFVYGSAFTFGTGGNLEGMFKLDVATGNVVLLEDCHGDTYDIAPIGSIIYTVSHAHYCSTVGAFPQSDPWATNMRHALAFTDQVTGTLGHNIYGSYTDWFGTPSPSMHQWFPDMTNGTASGQSQAAWSVTGNSGYVVLAGEFPTVNGSGQQGLVRFQPRATAAAKTQGPRLYGSTWPLRLTAQGGTRVRIAWEANWDRDSRKLTYTLSRNGTVISTQQLDSSFWELPAMIFTDTNLTPGQTYTYRVTATDADGNLQRTDIVPITTPTTGGWSNYAQSVVDDGASLYYRLGDSSTSAEVDYAGLNDGAVTGVTRGTSGAIAGDSDASSTFTGNGGSMIASSKQLTGPNVFTTEAWVRTTSTSGGKIIGFGNSATGDSSGYDRHTYMDNAGHIFFGVYPNTVAVLSSPDTYNDGQWHQIVSSLGAGGMQLWIDGRLIASRADVTSGQEYGGYWRVGGDNLGGWPNQPGSNYLAGDIDEVSVYPTVLNKLTVQKHFTQAGGSLPTAPADAYGAAVFNDSPSLYWRLGDAAGATVADASGNADPGVVSGGVTFGRPGALDLNNTAVATDGTNGVVASSKAFSNPTTYSEELWFNTTTTNGGKLIGFGDQQSASSNNYDRHVWMQNDGTLVFGTYTGDLNTITSPASYNDGTWHHMVATQGGDGMKLYVDGALVGTHPQTGAQSYTGYWRIGGDPVWFGSNSWYFAGDIDEVAVYPSVLSASAVAQHHSLGAAVNQLPTASFTSSSVNLAVSVDGSGSTDPDGTVASYSWNWGDGSADTTGTSATATHTYAAAGTKSVTLTVTDNRGGKSTAVSKDVTVTAANQLPTASFTSSSADLVASVDGSDSSDPDGTVASYSWNWGDGSADTTGTSATATHTYAAAGTYTVTLTVTDDRGGKSTPVSKQVTVSAANQVPTASFTASSANLVASVDGSGSSDPDGTVAGYSWKWGDTSADTTGASATATHTYTAAGTYTVTLTVTDDRGGKSTPVSKQVTVSAANQVPTASFTASSANLVASVDGSGSSDPDGTVASYSWNWGDTTPAGSGATATHTYAAAGTYTVTLTVTDDRGGKSTPVSKQVTVSAANQVPTASFTASSANLVASVDGSGSSDPDGTVASYSWNWGDTTPAGSGATATHTYTAAGTYTVTLTVTDDRGGKSTPVSKQVTVSAANQLPTASFTSSSANLVASVDGSGSSDPDGTVAGYSWKWGDTSADTTGASATATHTYTAAGTYTVTLTVTDNKGGKSAAVSKQVTVTAPAGPVVVAQDTFTRTVTNSWGTAETGGAWTASNASQVSVGSGVGVIRIITKGTGPTMSLNALSAQGLSGAFEFSGDKVATGGGTYITAMVRRSAAGDYRVKVRLVADNTIQLSVGRLLGSTESAFQTITVPGVTYTPGARIKVSFEVTNSSATVTTLRAKAWSAAGTEPAAWQVSGTDSSAGLQTAGSLQLQTYMSGTSTNAPLALSFDNLVVRRLPA
ncbi:PKD domain-containing protein [Nakamurella sp. A5-74]|uniref:PKD domain-containing protein n=1 Tax=Nakamurella sp. A5-74 TaxID=3158264 RepID=A0AAU8DLC4_9ACTN